MKIFSLIRLFFTSKWRFILPKKSKIMIYDQVGSDFLIKFFNEKECKILHTRFEEINVSILLMSIFKFYKENLKLSKKYVYQYIHYVKPQLIITYIDNNISYYKLK